MELRSTTKQAGFVQGEEVVYLGRELKTAAEPFSSAVEIWVEVQLLPVWGDLYLFSCRMPDGTWEMSQVGLGRDFKKKG